MFVKEETQRQSRFFFLPAVDCDSEVEENPRQNRENSDRGSHRSRAAYHKHSRGGPNRNETEPPSARPESGSKLSQHVMWAMIPVYCITGGVLVVLGAGEGGVLVVLGGGVEKYW